MLNQRDHPSQTREHMATLAHTHTERLRQQLADFCLEQNLKFYFSVDDLTHRDHANKEDRITIHIEPGCATKDPKFDGMQILFEGGTYEVSEYQAGPNQDRLYIYKDTPYLKTALKDFLKGNNRKPIKVW